MELFKGYSRWLIFLIYVGCGVIGFCAWHGQGKDEDALSSYSSSCDSLTGHINADNGSRAPEAILMAVEQEFGYPCIVKPANMGLSIGVSNAADRKTLEQAIAQAAEYDTKIIIERWLNVRELSCAVLGNEEPKTSLIGELVTEMTLLDYDAKYLHPGFHFDVPVYYPSNAG